jgi:hypothetical protein
VGAALLAALAAACGGERTGGAGTAAGGAWDGTVRDSAGVQVVENPATPVWGEGQGWTVEEVLKIGSADDPATQFGQIAGIGVAADGDILVLDQQGQEVKVFGPDGAPIRTFGEAGNGPGQLTNQAAGLMVGRGDTTLVWDPGNGRVNRFLPDGTAIGSFPIDMARGIPFRWEMTSEGDPISQLRQLALPGAPAPDSMDALVEWTYAGDVVDTVMRVRSGETVSFASGRPEFHFFSPEPMWTISGDDGITTAVNNAMRFSVYGIDGSLRRVIELPRERQEVTEEDRTLFLGALENAWKQAGLPQNVVAQLKESVSFEPEMPDFVQFLAGPESSLWVQRIVAPSEMTQEEKESFNPLQNMGSPEWDVFDGAGRWMGVVRMPLHFQPIDIQGDRIYGVWRDEMDVQHVMVMRVAGLD